MRPVPDHIEVVDEQMAEVLRHKNGAERLAIASGMFNFARQMIQTRLREEHPDWPEAEIVRESARRLSHGSV